MARPRTPFNSAPSTQSTRSEVVCRLLTCPHKGGPNLAPSNRASTVRVHAKDLQIACKAKAQTYSAKPSRGRATNGLTSCGKGRVLTAADAVRKTRRQHALSPKKVCSYNPPKHREDRTRSYMQPWRETQQ